MMTLSAIDQALDFALAGILFGSVTWIAAAFSIFVVTHKRKQKRTSTLAALPAARVKPMLAPASVPLLQLESASVPLLQAEPLQVEPLQVEPGIEIIIEQQTPKVHSSQLHSSQPPSVSAPAPKTQKPTVQKLEIVCEPVNWKKWKVADLRKASFAKSFGVRTRPIGSKRNLPKADLIAQYEQQLKRLTKAADKEVGRVESVA
ncbi:MAG: hypothetical protein AAGN15_20270 [Cyanobacteria bacterium J06581_3]